MRLAVDVVTYEWSFCKHDRRFHLEQEVILPAGTEVREVKQYVDGDGWALLLPDCSEQYEVRSPLFNPERDVVSDDEYTRVQATEAA